MKKTTVKFLLVAIGIALANVVFAQENETNYKHPSLNSSGRVLDEKGTELGWITQEGIVYNAKGEKVAVIKQNEVTDEKGKKLGKIDKNGTYYTPDGSVIFTIETGSSGEQCKIFDAQGKVVAIVHDSYKNQACAIHCLTKKMPMK